VAARSSFTFVLFIMPKNAFLYKTPKLAIMKQIIPGFIVNGIIFAASPDLLFNSFFTGFGLIPITLEKEP